jgi:hypothetical protein
VGFGNWSKPYTVEMKSKGLTTGTIIVVAAVTILSLLVAALSFTYYFKRYVAVRVSRSYGEDLTVKRATARKIFGIFLLRVGSVS